MILGEFSPSGGSAGGVSIRPSLCPMSHPPQISLSSAAPACPPHLLPSKPGHEATSLRGCRYDSEPR